MKALRLTDLTHSRVGGIGRALARYLDDDASFCPTSMLDLGEAARTLAFSREQILVALGELQCAEFVFVDGVDAYSARVAIRWER